MEIKVSITRDTATPHLKAWIRKLQNPQQAFRAIGQRVVDMSKQAFSDASKRPSPWAALSARTLARKAAKGQGSSPLIASGTMARSPRVITSSSTYVTVGADRKAGKYSLAAIHQLGAPKAGIPARPFFPIDANGKISAPADKAIVAIIKSKLGPP